MSGCKRLWNQIKYKIKPNNIIKTVKLFRHLELKCFVECTYTNFHDQSARNINNSLIQFKVVCWSSCLCEKEVYFIFEMYTFSVLQILKVYLNVIIYSP